MWTTLKDNIVYASTRVYRIFHSSMCFNSSNGTPWFHHEINLIKCYGYNFTVSRLSRQFAKWEHNEPLCIMHISLSSYFDIKKEALQTPNWFYTFSTNWHMQNELTSSRPWWMNLHRCHEAGTKPFRTNVVATSLWTRQIYCQNIFHHWRSFMTRFVGFDSFNGSWLESSSFVELLQPMLKELKSLKSQAKDARNLQL